jgi:hypothetical protein
MRTDAVQLQQTLHGYNGGHKLLRSSLTLPPVVQREMVILSDLSGPNASSTLEPYYTGYPVPALRRYAFAKTWLAPEMSRPGCVWTHTLLIDTADLARIYDLRRLRQHFVRPDSPELIRRYERPFEWDMDSHDLEDSKPIHPYVLTELIAALYGFPEKPVVLSIADRVMAEDMTLAVWSQQWPRMRQEFSFCTYSLSDRSRTGIRFDLQVIPPRLTREFRRASSEIVLIDEDQSSPSERPRWAHAAARDVSDHFPSGWRDWLWTLASSVRGNARKAFAPIIELTSLFDVEGAAQVDPQRLLDVIAERFPTPADGSQLKQLLLGVQRLQTSGSLSERDLLTSLATTEHWAAFDPSSLKLRSRAANLWQTDLGGTADLLLIAGSDMNPLAEQIRLGVADGAANLSGADLRKLPPRLVLPLVRVNPNIARHPEVWEIRSDEHSLYEAWLHGSGGDDVDPEVVQGILTAGCDGLARRLSSLNGPVAESVLEWVELQDKERIDHLGTDWLQLISRDAKEVIRWLGNRDQVTWRAILVIVRALSPQSADVTKYGSGNWCQQIERASRDVQRQEFAWLCAFGFGVAMEIGDIESIDLMSRCFLPLHSIAANEELPESLWQKIPRLPTMGWSETWDWCERLRRGLVRSFVEHDWPAIRLLDCVRDPAVLETVIASSREVRRGRRLIKNLLNEAREAVPAIPKDLWDSMFEEDDHD